MQIRLKIENDYNSILTDLTPDLPYTENEHILSMQLTTEQVQWLAERLEEFKKTIARPGGHHTIYITK